MKIEKHSWKHCLICEKPVPIIGKNPNGDDIGACLHVVLQNLYLVRKS